MGADLGDTGTLPVAAGQPFKRFPPFDPDGTEARWGLKSEVVYEVGGVPRLVASLEENGEAAGLLVVRLDGPGAPAVLATYGVQQGGNGASIDVSDAWSDAPASRLVLLTRITRRSRSWLHEGKEMPAATDVTWAALLIEPTRVRLALDETTGFTGARLVPTDHGVSLVVSCGDEYTLGADALFHPPAVRRCKTH